MKTLLAELQRHQARHRSCVEWRGLNVAELAKSFGLPSNSPKAYAASATIFPLLHAIRHEVSGAVDSLFKLNLVVSSGGSCCSEVSKF